MKGGISAKVKGGDVGQEFWCDLGLGTVAIDLVANSATHGPKKAEKVESRRLPVKQKCVELREKRQAKGTKG